MWAGLYCLPVFDTRDALVAALPAGVRPALVDDLPFLHVLTHKDLHLHPVAARLPARPIPQREGSWFSVDQWPSLGLPAPIRKLLAA